MLSVPQKYPVWLLDLPTAFDTTDHNILITIVMNLY